MPQQDATKATPRAASKTALAEVKDEQQALAEAAKAAEATGATDAEPAKHLAQAAGALPEEKHKPVQQVTQLAACVVKATWGNA